MSVHTYPLAHITNAPEFATYYAMQRPTAAACLACPELGVCGGGMPVNRWRDDNGYDNPSVYCADQLLLIGHMRNRLATLLSPGRIRVHHCACPTLRYFPSRLTTSYPRRLSTHRPVIPY